jgi:hypothetical protein
MSGKFIVGWQHFISISASYIYFLNKELQAEEIDWTDVQYELTRTRNSINNIKDEDIFIESKEISRKTEYPLAHCDTMPIHNTSHYRATTVTYWRTQRRAEEETQLTMSLMSDLTLRT